MTFIGHLWYNQTAIKIDPVLWGLRGLGENRESGANPERYRHCMRGGTARGESRSLGWAPEKAVRRLRMRKSGYLLD